MMKLSEEKQVLETMWECMVKYSSLAFYIIRNDVPFTLLYGNDAFYDLLQVTKDEVQYKFGNSLTALLDTKEYQNVVQSGTQHCEFIHEIECKEKEISLYTQVQFSEKERLLVCFSKDISQYEKDHIKLVQLEQIMKSLLPHCNQEIFVYDQETDYVNLIFQHRYLKEITSILSFDTLQEALIKQSKFTDVAMRIMIDLIEMSLHQTKTVSKEVQLSDGEWINITAIYVEFYESSKTVLVMLQDITAEKNIYFDYLNESQFYHMLLSEKEAYAHINVTKDSFYSTGGVWDLYNELIYELTYTQLYNRFINKVVHPDDRAAYLELMDCQNLKQSYQNGTNRLKYEFRRIIEQNKMMWMEIEILLFHEPTEENLMGLMFLNNIDQRKKSNFQLQYKSEIDQLTNVYNKVAAEHYIREVLMQDQEHQHAFMILDLDNFKEINDQHGHQIGDDILIRFSSKMRSLFHENCIIGRFGGDEFIIFMKQISSVEDIEQPLRALYDSLGKQETIKFSVGITLIREVKRYETIFQEADQALYRVKYSKKGTFGYFQKDGESTTCVSHGVEPIHTQHAVASLVTNTITTEEFDRYLGEFGEMAYLVDPDHFDLLLGNQSFYDRVGLTKEQCRGMKCYEVMHHRDSPCPFCGKANWARDKYFIWKDINQCLEQEFLIKNKLISWDDQEVLLALAIDISNDKSIVDSLESSATESHILLSSIQHMQEHMELQAAMNCILESICIFFKADYAAIWQKDPQSGAYRIQYEWRIVSGDTKEVLSKEEMKAFDQWLKAQRWDQFINIESPQEMLSQSYELYQLMQRYHVHNQRWISLQEQGNEYGCLVISNLSANFRNVSFLSSLSIFIINEIKKQQLMEAMNHANHYDQLTDVLNRNRFEYFARTFDPESVDSLYAVIANIDHLKEINRVNGSATGDQYIRKFAHLLRGGFPSADIYRLNGDEFLVISMNQNRQECDEQLKAVKRKLIHEDFNVSFGYAWDHVEKGLDELIATATYIMQVNKKHHYEELRDSKDTHQRKLLRDLVEGIKNHEFVVYLQPKMDMVKQQVIGAEALIRQHHKEFGILQPSEFIPALESNSLIRYIDLFVFEEICKLLEQRKEEGLMFSLNFSRVTLMEESMIDNMKQILQRYDFPRSLMEIEMTESVKGENAFAIYEAAREISRLGLRISLDDFGIRYSNLSILTEIYFDTIKLDKSLIKSLEKEKRNRLIVRNIIHMCNDLNIQSIAEGVESKLQEDILIDLGCLLGQGYLYGKPIPLDEFCKLYMKEYTTCKS